MGSPSSLLFLTFAFVLLLASSASSFPTSQLFTQCLQANSPKPIPFATTFFTPQNNASFTAVFESTAQNQRYTLPSFTKPEFIFTPLEDSHVQAAVICAKKLKVHMRLRSGGHDFEGLSFVSLIEKPFMIIDLAKLSAIQVDIESKTAWVESGALVGEVYYRIAEKSPEYSFSGGTCPQVAIGGFITGGGFGFLHRKYGLSADNVVDVRIVDANGKILDRAAMGEDLFWALRGGGGGSFGVILSWKIKLVRVPPIVTACQVDRTLEQNGNKILHKWQQVVPNFEEELYMRVQMQVANSSTPGKKTVKATYVALFQGRADRFLQLMGKKFPELGLTKNDCSESSVVKSVAYVYGVYPNTTASPDILIQRTISDKVYWKAKSDFMRQVIPESALNSIWKRFMQDDNAVMVWVPFGGKMDRISETEIPFPHRKGVLYTSIYEVRWNDGETSMKKHMNWIRRFYNFMAPYASRFPREAYLNYRDLDLGINKFNNKSFLRSNTWGLKYFGGKNFMRLVKVKSEVDPNNLFRHEQSIPPLPLNN